MKEKEKALITIGSEREEELKFAFALGFTRADDVDSSEGMVALYLPPGWELLKDEESSIRRLTDENGFERGLWCSDVVVFGTRYTLVSTPCQCETSLCEHLTFYDRKNDQVLIDFGHFEKDDICGFHLDMLYFARKTLEESYPGWEDDPTKYWED